MRLIKRTNLFLIGLIFLQAVLAYNFLTISLVNFSQREGRRLLNEDFKTIERHYSQLKNQVWADLVHLDNTFFEPASEPTLPRILELVNSENLDYIILSREELTGEELSREGGTSGVYGINLKHPYSDIPYKEIPLKKGRWHPALSLERRADGLFLVGALQVDIAESGENPFVVNLIKEIDNGFAKDLCYNTLSGVILYSGSVPFSGTFDPRYYFEEIEQFHARNREEGPATFFDIEFYDKSYNILLSELDTLSDRNTEVSIAVFSPNLSIKQRFSTIQNQFLMISILCVILAMIISLFISRSISRPVQELGRAMDSLTKGYFPTVNPVKTATEISNLYRDFNAMVERMKYNSSQQIALIQEITFLKTYNEQVVESIREGIAIIDKTEHLNLMNRAFLGFCPEIDPSGNPRIEDVPFWNEELATHLEKVKNRSRDSFSTLCRVKEGKLYDVRLYPLNDTGYDRSTQNSTVMMVNDITDKDNMESHLIQLEKLNSLSILTAGVAHEINNPLASILSNVENLSFLVEDEEGQTSIQWIKKEIRRIANIVRSLFTFTGSDSRTSSGKESSSLYDAWVPQLDHYMKYLLKEYKNVEFVNALGEIPANLSIPGDEILQILINLLNNSVQAIQGGGYVKITSCMEHSGTYFELKVMDNGPGISPDIRNKIFDPFFTTKPVGKGTGLGLSIVYGLVNKHGGRIEFDSQNEEGSVFTLLFPVKEGTSNGTL
ncbi:MAG: ATP-binding protein [Spirochaetales bacterium]|nr:ATP-binding protein [Spirochaetales bacterium]